MKLAELIIADAHARGLRHFFGIPGGGAPLDLMEAGRKAGVQFVNVAHESTAAIAAARYGAQKGTAGLALSVKGVGAGNLVGGAANAYFERVPVVCLCETSPLSFAPKHLVQHISHRGMFGGISKHEQTLNPHDAPAILRDAVSRATGGRPGPVHLDLPSDLGGAEAGTPLAIQRGSPMPAPSPEQIAAARQLFAKAARPLVIAGADVARENALSELADFVADISAAVLVTMDARGVFRESDPRWAGVFTGSYGPNIIETEIMSKADLIVLIGVDSMMSHVPWKLTTPVLEVASSPEYESLATSPQLRINAGLKATLRALTGGKSPGFPVQEIRASREKVLRNFVRPSSAKFAAHDVVRDVRAALPPDGVLLSETGAFVTLLEHLWPVDVYGTFLGTSGGRTMGLMLPAALGAKLASPDRPMIGLGADGSTLMRLGELEVFARMKVAMPIVIINDRALGTMKSRQKSRGMPDYGLDLHEVDFAMIARACGLNGITANSPEDLSKALKAAMNAERTTVIDARIDPQPYQDGFGPTIGVLSAAK